MKLSTKFLVVILGLGFLYSFVRLFSGHGGSGLDDFFDALALTSLVLFSASVIIIVFNIRQIKKHADAFVFLFLGLPLTIMVLKNIIENAHYDRTPDLVPKYSRPVTSKIYIEDSSRIAAQIDSLVELKNRNTHAVKVVYAVIDTIIYSETGSQIFVSYIEKFKPNGLGNDFDPAYLQADGRDSIYWHLKEGSPNNVLMSGSYHDIISLKHELRKFYFNQYRFADQDSLRENYFWKRKLK